MAVRIGGRAWFIAGFVLCLIWINDGIGTTFQIVGTTLSGVVTFLGKVGTPALLIITALAFWLITRTWTENARAKFDMNRIWNQRRNYRLPPDERH